MIESYIILNNYNYALNEDFDYLDGFEPEWKEDSDTKAKPENNQEEKDN